MTTNKSLEAGIMILKNLDMFSEATRLLDRIEVEIIKQISSFVDNWGSDNQSWQIDPPEEKGLKKRSMSGYSEHWTKEGTPIASIWFDPEDENNKAPFFIANLCYDCGRTRMGFWFGLVNKANKDAWENAFNSITNEDSIILERNGFIKKDNYKVGGMFFLPIETITCKELSEAYKQDNYKNIVEKIRYELDKFLNPDVQASLDKIVNKVKEQL
ncbi:MAG: hypothetical protein ABIJ50_00980 [Pseudomonadota bacterium]